MITISKLAEYISAEPFRPFRINMASRQVYEIRHPEMITVGRAVVKIYESDNPNAPPHWHDVSMMLMESIEPISAPTTASAR